MIKGEVFTWFYLLAESERVHELGHANKGGKKYTESCVGNKDGKECDENK